MSLVGNIKKIYPLDVTNVGNFQSTRGQLIICPLHESQSKTRSSGFITLIRIYLIITTDITLRALVNQQNGKQLHAAFENNFHHRTRVVYCKCVKQSKNVRCAWLSSYNVIKQVGKKINKLSLYGGFKQIPIKLLANDQCEWESIDLCPEMTRNFIEILLIDYYT